MSRAAGELERIQAKHRACTRCVELGLLPAAHPVFSGRSGQRILLVGQAPGPIERYVTRPFVGRAGRQLMRWMVRAGFCDEADVRDRIYLTSVTTCFPGRRADGSGDRRPSPPEVEACSPWLEAYLALLQPPLVLLVGSLALSRFHPRRRLDDLVGGALLPDGTPVQGDPGEAPRVHLPLPHPSGQSRWLNEPSRVALLDAALARLAELVPWAERTPPRPAAASRPV